MSSFDLARLETILKSYDVKYSVEVSQEDLDQLAAQNQERSQNPRSRPTFPGVMEYIYLDVPDDKVDLIKNELEKLALFAGVGDGHELDHVDDGFDQLVAKNQQATQASKTLVFILALVVAGIIYLLNREAVNAWLQAQHILP